jgi:importin subunit beta-1
LFIIFYRRVNWQSIIRKVKGEIAPLADQIMQLLLVVMNAAAKSSTLLEDAFLTVGALTAAVEGNFVRYMDSFAPFLYTALQNHEEHAVCNLLCLDI